MTLRHHPSRIALLLALSAWSLCGCVARQAATGMAGMQAAGEQTPDMETVIAGGRGVADAASARKAVLLRVARDCLARGYQTFAFTAVGEPKPHLPNRPADAPPEIAAVDAFAAPTGIVPDIEPGAAVTVKFYKPGDPAGADKIFAGLIVANLAPR